MGGVNTIDDFVELVRDELGLAVTTETVGVAFDRLDGWDSVHLLALLTALERATGRRLSLPDVLETSSLAGVYDLAVAP
jgi:acyl carrier protein